MLFLLLLGIVSRDFASGGNNHPSFGSYRLSAPMDQGRVAGDLPGRPTRQTPQSSRAYLTVTFSIVKSCGSPQVMLENTVRPAKY